MKTKILGIITIILILLPYSVFASGYQGINTNININNANAINASRPMTERILGILQVAGSVISVVALIIIGIRYMLSSLEEKAQMKGIIGYYIAGCVLVFATSNVVGFAYDIITNLEHSWKTTNTVNATCTNEGYTYLECTTCDETRKDTIPALGHNWVKGEEVEPTCTESGYSLWRCSRSRCQQTKTETTTGALGHDYSEQFQTDVYFLLSEANCVSPAKYNYKCSRCSSKDVVNTYEVGEKNTSNHVRN